MHTVRRVLPHEYEKYRTHLKALDVDSRNLRFAHPMSEEIIDQLCDGWFNNKDKHILFAIENDSLDFVAIAHIALEGEMELAFSVLKGYQGQGMGDKLMTRAIQYCRTHNILHGNMVCLSHNRVIKHLCTKHGIHMHSEYGETLADIDLDAPNVTTFISEAADSNLAVMDYVTKRSLLPWTLVHKKFDSLN
jgi:GNAT superfamily N-acetyltransferase